MMEVNSTQTVHKSVFFLYILHKSTNWECNGGGSLHWALMYSNDDQRTVKYTEDFLLYQNCNELQL